MNTHLARSLLALLALSVVAGLQAATPSQNSLESAHILLCEVALDSVKAPKNVNGDNVTAGSSLIAVSMRLGKPDWVLPNGTWLYQGYKVRRTPAGERSADLDASGELSRSGTLIVRFVGQKVISLSLADEATIAALRQKPKDADNRTLLASGSGR